MDKAYDLNGNLVYAKYLNESNKGIKYKCFNKNCNGEFLFRNVRSNYKNSCFYYDSRHHDNNGNPLNEHIHNCWCLSSNDTNKYDKDDFNLSDFESNLNTSAPNSRKGTSTNNKNISTNNCSNKKKTY